MGDFLHNPFFSQTPYVMGAGQPYGGYASRQGASAGYQGGVNPYVLADQQNTFNARKTVYEHRQDLMKALMLQQGAGDQAYRMGVLGGQVKLGQAGYTQDEIGGILGTGINRGGLAAQRQQAMADAADRQAQTDKVLLAAKLDRQKRDAEDLANQQATGVVPQPKMVVQASPGGPVDTFTDAGTGAPGVGTMLRSQSSVASPTGPTARQQAAYAAEGNYQRSFSSLSPTEQDALLKDYPTHDTQGNPITPPWTPNMAGGPPPAAGQPAADVPAAGQPAADVPAAGQPAAAPWSPNENPDRTDNIRAMLSRATPGTEEYNLLASTYADLAQNPVPPEPGVKGLPEFRKLFGMGPATQPAGPQEPVGATGASRMESDAAYRTPPETPVLAPTQEYQPGQLNPVPAPDGGMSQRELAGGGGGTIQDAAAPSATEQYQPGQLNPVPSSQPSAPIPGRYGDSYLRLLARTADAASKTGQLDVAQKISEFEGQNMPKIGVAGGPYMKGKEKLAQELAQVFPRYEDRAAYLDSKGLDMSYAGQAPPQAPSLDSRLATARQNVAATQAQYDKAYPAAPANATPVKSRGQRTADAHLGILEGQAETRRLASVERKAAPLAQQAVMYLSNGGDPAPVAEAVRAATVGMTPADRTEFVGLVKSDALRGMGPGSVWDPMKYGQLTSALDGVATPASAPPASGASPGPVIPGREPSAVRTPTPAKDRVGDWIPATQPTVAEMNAERAQPTVPGTLAGGVHDSLVDWTSGGLHPGANSVANRLTDPAHSTGVRKYMADRFNGGATPEQVTDELIGELKKSNWWGRSTQPYSETVTYAGPGATRSYEAPREASATEAEVRDAILAKARVAQKAARDASVAGSGTPIPGRK